MPFMLDVLNTKYVLNNVSKNNWNTVYIKALNAMNCKYNIQGYEGMKDRYIN